MLLIRSSLSLSCYGELEVGNYPGFGVEVADFESGGCGAALLEGEDFAPTPGYVLPGFHGLLKNLPVGLGHRVTLTIHLKHYPHPAVAQPRSRRQRYGLVVILRRSRRIYRPQNLFLSQNLLLQELLRIDEIPLTTLLDCPVSVLVVIRLLNIVLFDQDGIGILQRAFRIIGLYDRQEISLGTACRCCWI